MALADGVVEEILVLEGQSVAKDQEVARLVDEDARLFLRAAKAAVGLAESRKQVAEARLASAQADWDNPIELERVVESAGATVDELDARLEQLPFQIDEAQAVLVSREQEAERLQDAADAGSASEIELIIAKAAAAAQASVVKQLERQDAVLRAQRARAASDLKAAQRHSISGSTTPSASPPRRPNWPPPRRNWKTHARRSRRQNCACRA
ncbi:MAG: hypothetical protein ACFHWZ_13835 [Phycisphaerales bacterium]